MAPPPDPYLTLGVDPSAGEEELHAAYRRLVQRHHPDHNGGSAESARRFELVQEAYAEVRRRRAHADAGQAPGMGRDSVKPASDTDLEARLAEMERELRAAANAREQALRQARRAAAGDAPKRPTDEELGYYTTDDSFTKIVDDAADLLGRRLGGAARSPAAHRLSELIDELTSKLTGEPPHGD